MGWVQTTPCHLPYLPSLPGEHRMENFNGISRAARRQQGASVNSAHMEEKGAAHLHT